MLLARLVARIGWLRLWSCASMVERTEVAAMRTEDTLSWTRCVAMGARYSLMSPGVNRFNIAPTCSVNSSLNLQFLSLSIFRNSSSRGRYAFLVSTDNKERKFAKCFNAPIRTCK